MRPILAAVALSSLPVVFVGVSASGPVAAGGEWHGLWLDAPEGPRRSVTVRVRQGTVEARLTDASGPWSELLLAQGEPLDCGEVQARIARVAAAADALVDRIGGRGPVPAGEVCGPLGELLALDPAAREPRLPDRWMLRTWGASGYLERWDRLRTASDVWDPDRCAFRTTDGAWHGRSSQWSSESLTVDRAEGTVSGPLAADHRSAGWLEGRFEAERCPVDARTTVLTNDD